MFMAVSDFNLQLAGSDALKQWFGDWPNFHDAEVISLNLSRKAQSVLRVYPYYPEKPATVEFVLNEITELELADFSSQNVISGLTIEQVTNKEGEAVLRLQMFPCYGLAGYIEAKRLQLNLIPGRSTDGGRAW